MVLSTTPSATLHRALPLQPLNWEYKPGRPRDGDVKSNVDLATGVKTYTLYAQPRKRHKYTGEPIYNGVSFFEPYIQFFKQIHQQLTNTGASAHGHDNPGCAVLVPNVSLPDGMAFVNDGKLSLPLEGDDRVECGEHYTLFATRAMPAAEFDALFAELISNNSIPCKLEGGAAPVNLQLDMDRSPLDKLTCAAMMALDALSSEATDPNVQWFAKLYALHLRATDMDFEDLLGFGPLASMAAAALEAWSVQDGLLMASACEAQDRLAGLLECKFTRPAYQPPWVSYVTTPLTPQPSC